MKSRPNYMGIALLIIVLMFGFAWLTTGDPLSGSGRDEVDVTSTK